MEAIKKKLQSYQNNLDAAIERAEQAERLLKEHRARADKAETEMAALSRRILLLEEDSDKTEDRLKVTSQKLVEVTQAADESDRMRKALEHRATTDEEKVEILENSLKEARLLFEESDKKYDEAARKLLLVEADLDRALERARVAESKQAELEDELKVIGNNLKSLELAEERALQKQQAQDLAMKTAQKRVAEAESRAEAAEKVIQKLQFEVDRLEDALVHERERYKHVSDELDQTYSELTAR